MKIDKSIKNMYSALRILRHFDINISKEKYLENKVTSIPGWLLIRSWRNEKDKGVKDSFEYLFAKKLNSFNPIIAYNDVPPIYNQYLEQVSSIDAIVELLKNDNQEVYDKAKKKYIRFFDSYLDYEEEHMKCKIIEFNGGKRND